MSNEELIDNAAQAIDKPLPEVTKPNKPSPDKTTRKKDQPKAQEKKKELPVIGHEENCVTIGQDKVEIKPTKLKYQRNRDAVFYKMLEILPVTDILAMDKGALDAERDGDKCLFDWLIAVFDSSSFVARHYDSMTSEDIENILEIFKRVNKIQDKQDQAKNRQTKENRH